MISNRLAREADDPTLVKLKIEARAFLRDLEEQSVLDLQDDELDRLADRAAELSMRLMIRTWDVHGELQMISSTSQDMQNLGPTITLIEYGQGSDYKVISYPRGEYPLITRLHEEATCLDQIGLQRRLQREEESVK